eukprot:7324587-Prymnesium_polylepis.1
MTHTPLSSRNTNRHGRALRRRVREAPAVGFVKQIPHSNIQGPLRKVMARRGTPAQPSRRPRGHPG